VEEVHDVKKALTVAVVLGVSLVGTVGVATAHESASATTYRLSAKMTPGQVVTPRNRPWRVPASLSNARGTFAATLAGRKLAWRITYTGLENQPLVIADIHLGKPGRFGAIVVRLCADCKSGQRGTKRLTWRQVGLLRRDTWITLITGKYPNGVVRGQIRTSS
jgi:hypothetical protein